MIRSTICSRSASQQFLLVVETQIREEFLGNFGLFQLLDVFQRDFDLDVLAANLLIGMRVGDVHLERARLAGLHAGYLLVQIDHVDPADTAGARDELGVVLMADFVAVELDVHVGDEVILVGHAAIFDRNQCALLFLQVVQRLLHVLVGDFDLGLLDLQSRDIRNRELRLHFDLERIAQSLVVLQLNGFGIVEFRLADDRQRILLDRLLIALGDERAANLFLHVGAEALLDELLRRVTRTEARDGGASAQFLELFAEHLIDAFLGDLDGDLLGGRPGVFDLDLVLVCFVGGFIRNGGFIFGHDTLGRFYKQNRAAGTRPGASPAY